MGTTRRHGRLRAQRALRVLLSAALISGLAACGGEDGGGTTLRLAHVFGVDSTQNRAAERLAELVAQRTGGELRIEVYPASQLGGDEALGQDVSRGALDLAFLNPGSLAGMDPLLDFHYLPYIAQTHTEADRLFYGDGIIPTTLTSTMREHGMHSLALFELEFRGVTNSRHPVTGLEDLRDLKIRVPGSAAIRSFFDAAGAQTLVMPMSELVTALEQDTVDGQDNGVAITKNSGLTQSQQYMTMTGHVYAVGSIAANEQLMERLTPEQRDVLATAAREVAAEQIVENRREIEADLQEVQADGMQLTELSPAAREELRRFGRSRWDELADRYGADRIEQLRAEVDAAAQVAA